MTVFLAILAAGAIIFSFIATRTAPRNMVWIVLAVACLGLFVLTVAFVDRQTYVQTFR